MSHGPTRTASKAARLTDLQQRLTLRPYGIAELARQYGVTRRTIERDLQTLRDLGHGLIESGHRYALPDRPSDLNEVEALAVYSATRLLVHTREGGGPYRTALEKLARRLPGPARSTTLAAVDRLEPGPDDRLLDLVAQAWFRGRVLRCTYHGATSGSQRRLDLEIWFFELNRRNLEPYVLAYDRTHAHAVRMYKLARMRDVRLLSERYVIPSDFDPLTHLDGAWGVVVGEPITVRLRVTPGAADWFREQRHRDPAVRIVDDLGHDGLIATLHGHIGSDGEPNEMLSFLLGWGPLIEVMTPDTVRERVARAVRDAAALYPD